MYQIHWYNLQTYILCTFIIIMFIYKIILLLTKKFNLKNLKSILLIINFWIYSLYITSNCIFPIQMIEAPHQTHGFYIKILFTLLWSLSHKLFVFNKMPVNYNMTRAISTFLQFWSLRRVPKKALQPMIPCGTLYPQ